MSHATSTFPKQLLYSPVYCGLSSKDAKNMVLLRQEKTRTAILGGCRVLKGLQRFKGDFKTHEQGWRLKLYRSSTCPRFVTSAGPCLSSESLKHDDALAPALALCICPLLRCKAASLFSRCNNQK